MSSGYNVVKKEILEILSELGEVTVRDIADITDRSYESVAMALLRYHRQGLLYRSGGREKIYELTEKGLERLNWIEDHFFIED